MNTYLIVSETIYYTDKILSDLKGNINNVITFNMDEVSINEILTEASYFSMFNEDKCIIIRNANFLSSSKSGDTKKSSEISEKILKYLEEENPHTRLIFILNGTPDGKKKLYKLIKDHNHVYTEVKMTKTDMKNELQKICQENNFSVLDKSLWYIINNSLNNFDLAYNELKKIMLYYGTKGEIKYEDVVGLTSNSLEISNFKLVDSIVAQDLDNALKLLEDSKVLKIEPTIIIALLYREFKLMMMVTLYEENKYSMKDILNNLHLTDWMLQKVKDNLRRYNKREIEEEIVNLSNLDYKIKSGNINKDVALMSYIINLCL